jgi:hypothetical protein
MVLFNIFEISFNVIFFFYRHNSEDFNKTNRIITLVPNMAYIITIQFLATITIIKKKIITYIYY